MDVNAIDVTGVPTTPGRGRTPLGRERQAGGQARDVDPFSEEAQSPYEVTALMEYKTVWHPMGA